MAAKVLTDDDLDPLRRELAELRALVAARVEAPVEWATPEQAAERLGVSAQTVRRWAASGRLPAEREGSRWRIHAGALPAAKPRTPEAAGLAAVDALVR